MNAKPFIKWAGGKTQLLPFIRLKYPKKIERYCEPFIGGGAVFFDIISTFQPEEILVNDINARLINAYQQLKNNSDNLISELLKLQEKYWSLSEDERKIFYIEQRKNFNTSSDNLQSAILFIFLNKTCFNGLYRVNKKGAFNVPIGSYKNPLICDAENLKIVSEHLQSITFKCDDFSECSDFIQQDTFVYLDPPYRPLEKSSFTAYDSSYFNDSEQCRLADFFKNADNKGAKVLMSNSDPKNTDENDDFFDKLYESFNIERVVAKRSINSNGKGRGNINELLISNY